MLRGHGIFAAEGDVSTVVGQLEQVEQIWLLPWAPFPEI